MTYEATDQDGDGTVESDVDNQSTTTEDVYLGQVSSTPTDSEIGTGNTAFYAKDDGSLYKKPYGGTESQVGGGSASFTDSDGDGNTDTVPLEEGKITVSSTQPSSPASGDVWIDNS